MKNKFIIFTLMFGLVCSLPVYAVDMIRGGVGLVFMMAASSVARLKCGSIDDATNATDVPASYKNLPISSIVQAKSADANKALKVAGELVLRDEMISAFFDEHELKDKADTLNVKFSTDIVCCGKGGTPYGGEKLYLYGTKNSQGGLDVLYWEPQYPLIRQSWSYTSEYDYPDFKTLEQTAKYDEARYAKFLLGKAYYEGKLVAKDDKKALEWAKKAYREDLSADRNFFAATLLGLLYAQNKDFKQAKFFLEQTRGYFNGHPKLEEIVGLEEFYGKAMYELGIIYYESKGIAKNPDVAMIIFKTIMQTEEFGMRYEPAKELFLKLYAKKYKTPYSKDAHNITYFFNIALQKYNDKDPSSLDIFEKLAKTGDTNSQNMAGVIYYEGELVPENLDKAKEFFLKAIKYEHPLAARNLANIYDYEGDDKNAKRYYKIACEWGEEESCEIVKEY